MTPEGYALQGKEKPCRTVSFISSAGLMRPYWIATPKVRGHFRIMATE